MQCVLKQRVCVMSNNNLLFTFSF